MSQPNNHFLHQYNNLVGIKFQLYNSLFTSLPFHKVERTGILNSLLLLNCEDGFAKGHSPKEIVDYFFSKQTAIETDEERNDLLFRLVQYIERQVVLFDALEDASFRQVKDWGGKGSLKQIANEITTRNKEAALQEKLKDFTVQLVLTAHPTQFYRGMVLGIIHDLSNAINNNNDTQIYSYLQQLGRTPFFQKQKPTPYDEAISLIWYLENIFFHAIGRIMSFMKNRYGQYLNTNHPIIKMGFWPGGDRDGNPFVNAQTTLKVAKELRGSIIKCYYQEVRKLKRRLTFKDVDVELADLEKKLYNNLFIPDYTCDITKEFIYTKLLNIQKIIKEEHNNLFADLVENLLNKVEIFGLHFATLDIRQDSSIHGQLLNVLAEHETCLPKNYATLTNQEKINILCNLTTQNTNTSFIENTVQKDVLAAMQAVQQIQQLNGEAGCNRYIISQCNSVLNIWEVYGLFLLSGWKKEELSVDIIPLFETIDDLQEAAQTMEQLYTHPVYQQHLQQRGNKQTIMLGFSDGTKDGGYLMANWGIYKAKEELTSISRKYNVDVVFFDGRGGPPARGGGKTHNFYASLGKNISNKELQLTIQGQTVSSNFGTIDAAQYNIEQLFNAGLANDVLHNENQGVLSAKHQQLIDELAGYGYEKYSALKNHEFFTDYMVYASPLKFYAETNIASRPTKRGKTEKLSLGDLRAIPFVGAWSQIKQNLTGYYGVGTALKKILDAGRWNEVKELYKDSLFFRTLLDNCEMAMKKCYFPLTAYLRTHPQYGELFEMIEKEYQLTVGLLLELSGRKKLMENYPVDQQSIQMRERIVLPLLTIQQYALAKLREPTIQTDVNQKEIFEKLVMRCSFGIINAARNSA
jgi:phosphoenolpyruvate carboxylase